MYGVRHDSKTNYIGYKPEKYEQMYYSEEGTPKEKINAMRRKFYQQNKDEINASKRAAYAKRKALESSKAEETNV